MLIAVAVMYILLVTPITFAHLTFFILGKNIFEVKEPDFVLFRYMSEVFSVRIPY